MESDLGAQSRSYQALGHFENLCDCKSLLWVAHLMHLPWISPQPLHFSHRYFTLITASSCLVKVEEALLASEGKAEIVGTVLSQASAHTCISAHPLILAVPDGVWAVLHVTAHHAIVALHNPRVHTRWVASYS